MNQPKKTVLKLADIVPDRIYFLPKTFEPVKVICTDTQGWQRGFVRVDLEIDRCPTIAWAQSMVSRRTTHYLGISRWRDEFYFCNSSGLATLFELQWVDLRYQKMVLDTEKFNLERRLREVNAHLKVLESL